MYTKKFKVASKADRTLDGIVFDSKIEMIRYSELKLLLEAGKIRALELQPKYPVTINNQHYCNYTADFKYLLLGNPAKIIIEDVKSAFTDKDPAFRLRRKAAELFYNITITSYIPNKKLTKSKNKVK